MRELLAGVIGVGKQSLKRFITHINVLCNVSWNSSFAKKHILKNDILE